MYNPEYCARPHVVALNKMDLQDAAQLQEEIASEVLTMAHRIQVGAELFLSIACCQCMLVMYVAWWGVLSPAAAMTKQSNSVQDESPEGNPKPSLPAAVVNVSAEAGTGLEELQAALQPLLQWQDAAAAAGSSFAEEAWG